MKTSLLTLTYAFALAAITFSLAVCAQAQTFSNLVVFDGVNGSAPNTVVQATDGNLYGTTRGAEPPVEFGNIVRVSPTGELTPIYTFCQKAHCADGAWPLTPPILGSDGNLYGVTSAGGSKLNGGFGWGTVYKMTLTGQITTLHIFCQTDPCSDGSTPGGVMQASDGNLYGTTAGGGQYDEGTLFKLTTTGTYTILHNFCSSANCADGLQPSFPPIQGNDGSLIGTTQTGGINGGGVVWALTPAGNFNIVHRFPCGGDPCPRGSAPLTLTQDGEGNLFGVAAGGGDDGQGAIFEITAAHQFKILHSFTGGDFAGAGLTLANDGNLYGRAQGINGFGDIFQITPDGAYSILHTFSSQTGITDPNSALFQAPDGEFYGSALSFYDGSAFDSNGALYSLDDNLSPLVQPIPRAGKVGKSVLILGNHLTGTTGVTFNGVQANFTVKSDTYIQATVPTGATTGIVSVVTPSGTLNSNPQFVVTQ